MRCLVLVLVLASVAFATEPLYTSKYDSIDLDAVLGNPRLVNFYVNCLLDRGPCNEEGQTLKSLIDDALVHGCSRCSEKHKFGVKKVVSFLVHNRPNDWDALVEHYDPDHLYRDSYQQYLVGV